jgi:hypothetical protein
MEENGNIQLMEEESRLVAAYQKVLGDTKYALGSLRNQYLLAEAKLMGRIENTEKDLLSHLRMLAQSKGISLEENWIFDSTTFSFVKK